MMLRRLQHLVIRVAAEVGGKNQVYNEEKRKALRTMYENERLMRELETQRKEIEQQGKEIEKLEAQLDFKSKQLKVRSEEVLILLLTQTPFD
ncbi:hypothetical protein MKX01_026552 [Papaver californicum]|nr:hypothetical protein MKX01_026552 [Papaver californicum]